MKPSKTNRNQKERVERKGYRVKERVWNKKDELRPKDRAATMKGSLKTKRTGLKRKGKVETKRAGLKRTRKELKTERQGWNERTGLKLETKRTGLTQKGRSWSQEESWHVKETADTKRTRFRRKEKRDWYVEGKRKALKQTISPPPLSYTTVRWIHEQVWHVESALPFSRIPAPRKHYAAQINKVGILSHVWKNCLRCKTTRSRYERTGHIEFPIYSSLTKFSPLRSLTKLYVYPCPTFEQSRHVESVFEVDPPLDPTKPYLEIFEGSWHVESILNFLSLSTLQNKTFNIWMQRACSDSSKENNPPRLRSKSLDIGRMLPFWVIVKKQTTFSLQNNACNIWKQLTCWVIKTPPFPEKSRAEPSRAEQNGGQPSVTEHGQRWQTAPAAEHSHV